jgi:hypothetical protein
VAFILGVEERRWIGHQAALHRAVSLLEEDDDRRGIWGGLLVGLVGGLRSGKSSSLFFYSSVSFLFCFIFWFQIIYLNSILFVGF